MIFFTGEKKRKKIGKMIIEGDSHIRNFLRKELLLYRRNAGKRLMMNDKMISRYPDRENPFIMGRIIRTKREKHIIAKNAAPAFLLMRLANIIIMDGANGITILSAITRMII